MHQWKSTQIRFEGNSFSYDSVSDNCTGIDSNSDNYTYSYRDTNSPDKSSSTETLTMHNYVKPSLERLKDNLDELNWDKQTITDDYENFKYFTEFEDDILY